MTEIFLFQPGIYFGLSEASYRADPALSYSGMKDLIEEGPETYWLNSPMNPSPSDTALKKSNDAMRKGKAFHTMLLEPEAFLDRYYLIGAKKKEETIGKEILLETTLTEIKEKVTRIRTHKLASTMFSGGYPEVSMFWVDQATGVRMKGRLDYLKLFSPTDLKNTGRITDKGLNYTIGQMGYDIQAAVYVEGETVLKQAIKDGQAKVYGTADKNFLKVWLDMPPSTSFFVVFQLDKEPYSIRIMEFSDFDEGNYYASVALKEFKKYYDMYGMSKWLYPEMITRIDPYNLPRRRLSIS